MPNATDTFKDSLMPFIGISINLSIFFKTAGVIPLTSFPKTRTAGSFSLNLFKLDVLILKLLQKNI